ncbi:uncharacterized protein LOC133909244 [Phragmites australis]|uniref:uncharacterized protein LOC133909244 n=1 Tax=Phragmites australis TaxID=29695 RepID=UPI002D76C8DC|nr:uncharacterized protein LOC133909244 [Phragmites australis]
MTLEMGTRLGDGATAQFLLLLPSRRCRCFRLSGTRLCRCRCHPLAEMYRPAACGGGGGSSRALERRRQRRSGAASVDGSHRASRAAKKKAAAVCVMRQMRTLYTLRKRTCRCRTSRVEVQSASGAPPSSRSLSAPIGLGMSLSPSPSICGDRGMVEESACGGATGEGGGGGAMGRIAGGCGGVRRRAHREQGVAGDITLSTGAAGTTVLYPQSSSPVYRLGTVALIPARAIGCRRGRRQAEERGRGQQRRGRRWRR